MTKQEFKILTQSGLVYLDGATGTNLSKQGMPAGVCPEQWILEHPEIFTALQGAYAEAGSHIVYAPTFTGNRIKLAEYGLEEQIREINGGLVRLSKQAVGSKVLVAGDITMTGKQLRPMGSLDMEELITVYREQVTCLADAGADLLVIETMMSLQEARAALIAARETCDLPVMVSMTFEPNAKTLFGTDARTVAVVLESLGASAIGVNCSTGPDKMLPIIRDMAAVSTLPIIAKPNAGLPSLDDEGNTVFDMEAEVFACHMAELVEAGATILGGCCGTYPDFINKTVQKCADIKPVPRENSSVRHLASGRRTLSFGLDDPFIVVGERINPTGKKKLQEELRNGKLDMVLEFTEEQEAGGAAVLDVNMGMGGIDEKEMMLRALEEIGMATSLPLSVDSSHVGVIEAALRHYPGRALINSISYETAKFEELLPIAAHYGAMFILLPLSDRGLPKDMAERIDIIEKITARALSLGMKKEDIIVDGLVTTVGANQNAALETLETIRYCKVNGYATICGLSNISFGLPERSYVNTAFLTMAIREGLTMAIANPSQDLLVSCALASDLLLNKASADIRYIDQMNMIKEHRQNNGPSHKTPDQPDRMVHALDQSSGVSVSSGTEDSPKPDDVNRETNPSGHRVREAVLKGWKHKSVEFVKAALAEGLPASVLLNEYLLPAINEVGELFDKGRYYLPQLIAGAEAMKLAIDYLEPLLRQDNYLEKSAVVVIATVKGDIHDIGKNLVALMLKNHGYQVIDLGKDIGREEIIHCAIANKADIIALSALMTTTMPEMKRVVEMVRQKNVPIKVVVGGAVITREYAAEIGADAYSKDAADAVRVIRHLLA